jgi:hypothetical protein
MNATLAVPTGKKPWDWPITRHAEISMKPCATGATSANVQSCSVSRRILSDTSYGSPSSPLRGMSRVLHSISDWL